jgi:hypothetical protein
MAITAKENWKALPGFDGKYEVSDYGNVRSLDGYRGINMYGAKCYLKGRQLKQRVNYKGYKVVQLPTGAKVVHRLVAMAFFPLNCDMSQFHINHIDCDKQNNCVENLEWCTQEQNTAHAVENGRYSVITGEKNNNAKLNPEKVTEIRKLLSDGLKPLKIANMFNVKYSCIESIKHGRTWKHI